MFDYTQLEEEKVDFFEIAPVDDLPNGERLFVDIGDNPIVIFNIAGKFYAIGDVCTHDDGPLGDGIQCRVPAPRCGVRSPQWEGCRHACSGRHPGLPCQGGRRDDRSRGAKRITTLEM